MIFTLTDFLELIKLKSRLLKQAAFFISKSLEDEKYGLRQKRNIPNTLSREL